MAESRDDAYLQRLVEHAADLDHQIMQWLQTIDSGHRVVATVFSVGTVAALHFGRPEIVLVAVPLALMVLVHVLWACREVVGRGGVKAALEERIRDGYGGPVMIWETTMAPRMVNGLGNRLRIVLYFLLAVAGTWFAVSTAIELLDVTRLVGYLALLVACWVAASVLGIQGLREFDIAFGIAQEQYERAGPPDLKAA